MAFLSIRNVKIAGISACVPKQEEFCFDFPLFSKEESLNFSKTTGVISRRIASLELLTLLRQKVKHKKLTFVEYEKTKNTLRQGI